MYGKESRYGVPKSLETRVIRMATKVKCRLVNADEEVRDDPSPSLCTLVSKVFGIISSNIFGF